ncbi:MAG: NUDIX domain-containing protein [Bryobacteraceae bacterium]|nr:NUDIX domain-containing protein [Bryobacteraceae bacterium]
MTSEQVLQAAESFADSSDGSAWKSRELVLQLVTLSPAPFSRHQYEPGHVTATGLVLHPAGRALLLVHHRRLRRWLLPGGHVEAGDPEIAATAFREVREETGALLLAERGPVVGIDVHGIPAKKKEPFHLHHDLIIGFRAASEELSCSKESFETLWCEEADFDRYDLPLSIRFSYRRAIAQLGA